jgi:hypothetical protein
VKLVTRVIRASVPELIRIACVLSLAALLLMAVSVLWPRPLVVISAMSVGHVLGGGGFVCYLLAVVLDAASREPETPKNLEPTHTEKSEAHDA